MPSVHLATDESTRDFARCSCCQCEPRHTARRHQSMLQCANIKPAFYWPAWPVEPTVCRPDRLHRLIKSFTRPWKKSHRIDANNFCHAYGGAELQISDSLKPFDRSVYFDEIRRNEHIHAVASLHTKPTCLRSWVYKQAQNRLTGLRKIFNHSMHSWPRKLDAWKRHQVWKKFILII